jgi:hypothetical protein
VSRGHLEYLETISGACAISETSDSPSLESKMHQHMEVDADISAMLNLTLGNIDRSNEELSLQNFRGMMTVFAFTFSLFDLSIRTSSTYREAAHPDPDLRLWLSSTYVATAMEDLTGQPLKRQLADVTSSLIPPCVKTLRELGVSGGGFQLRLAAQCDEGIGSVVDQILASHFQEALGYQERWTERIGRQFSDLQRRLSGAGH